MWQCPKELFFSPVWCGRLWLALISTPLNSFGMNWNSDWKQGLIDQHQCLYNLTNALVAEVQVRPGSKTLWKTFSEGRRLFYQQIKPSSLEWDDDLRYLITTLQEFYLPNFTQSFTSPLMQTMCKCPLSPSTSPPLSVLWPSAFLLWCYLLSWQLTPGLWATWTYKCPCWLHMLRWSTSERLFICPLFTFFMFSFTPSAHIRLISPHLPAIFFSH